jgi:hypothetical protein
MRKKNRMGQSQRSDLIWVQAIRPLLNPIIRMREWTPSDDLILIKLKLKSLNF